MDGGFHRSYAHMLKETSERLIIERKVMPCLMEVLVNMKM